LINAEPNSTKFQTCQRTQEEDNTWRSLGRVTRQNRIWRESDDK